MYLRKPARGLWGLDLRTSMCTIIYYYYDVHRERARGGGGGSNAARPLPLLTPLPLWLCLCLRDEVNANLFVFGRGDCSFCLRVVLAPALPCALNGLS